MSTEQIQFVIVSWLALTVLTYTLTGWKNIASCYQLWFNKDYWTPYNLIEAAGWITKAAIIIPGLVFGINIWQLYIVAIITSASLIWASNRKLLPTLVAFNTMWIGLSLVSISLKVIE